VIVDRKTVGNLVQFDGFGLHSGVPVEVRIHPSDTGIWFRFGSERVEAKPENVTDTSLCTRLGSIATVEHIMSALAGCEITDAEIEVSASELPAMDGSAYPFVEVLASSGHVSISEIELEGLFSRVFEHEGDSKIAIGAGSGHWRYEFHSQSRYPYDQVYETHNVVSEYSSQIARARTFGWEDQQDEIAEMGLAKGLCMETCLLLGADGPVNESRFPDEPTRHKLLDAIGDIYLSGIPIRFLNVVCTGSGHKMNVQAAHKLMLHCKAP
jgi:UDP-3-O-acyl-N-acetylglucosamine deacetylase